MQLTPHFSLEEFERSEFAQRKNVDNSIPKGLLDNAKRLAETMEKVRTLLKDNVIVVNSAYRCPEVNKAVGGASSSYHVRALACDFVCPAFGTPYDICRAIAPSGIVYDQLIFEGTWVHLGLAESISKPRMQILTMRKGKYYSGIQNIEGIKMNDTYSFSVSNKSVVINKK